MKGEISQPSRALVPWRGGFASKNFSAQNNLKNSPYFSLIFLYTFQPPYHEDHGCIYREMGVWKGQRGVEGAAFLPPPPQLPHVHANHVLSPFAEKKDKKNAEMGLGTQCRPKNLSVGRHCFEKLECRPALHFGLFKTFFFWLFFNLPLLAIHCGMCMGRKTDFSALPKAFLACMSEI